MGRLIMLLVFLAVAAGIVLRLVLILKGRINSDEAIVGLMAMEIQKGNHFAFYWGQGYMGSLEAYVAALFFSFFGATPPVLKMVPAMFFLAAAVFHYLFAKRIMGRGIALMSFGLLFISPSVFSVWTVAPRGGYMESLALGGAALYLGAVIRQGEMKSPGMFLLLGLLCGAGFWTHYFFVYYILALALGVFLPSLLQRGGLTRIGAASVGFLAGVSPVIIHNIRNSFPSLKVMSIASSIDYGANIFNLIVRQIPTLLGANKLVVKGPLWTPISWMLLALFILALVYYPIAALRRTGRITNRPFSLLAMPLVIVAAGIVLFLCTGFGAFNTQRYLLPLYPMFIIFLAAFLRDMAGWRKSVAVLMALLVVSANVYGNWHFLRKNHIPESAVFMKDMNDILSYCRENEIRTAYAGHWLCYVLTFLSRQELVVADIDRDRYLPFQHLVAESSHPAIISEGYMREISQTLQAAGYSFDVGNIGDITVFNTKGQVPEIGKSAGLMEAWVQETGGGEFDTLSGGGVISRTTQRKGMSITFSLGGIRPINGLVVSPGTFRKSYPRRFMVQTSTDGIEWTKAADVRTYIGGIYHLERLEYEKNGWASIYFPPREAYYIRLVLKRGWDDRHWAAEETWASLAAE